MKIRPLRYLGGRVNRHWLVEGEDVSGRKLILQAYCGEQITGTAYEHEVIRRLHGLNWPVLEIVSSPLYESGELWVLFTFLPGYPAFDRQLIIPCYWSWLFLGVKDEIDKIKGGAPVHSFDWQIRHFLMRSKFMDITAYP